MQTIPQEIPHGNRRSDGHAGVWVPDEGTGSIVHVASDGSGIAAGPDGDLWFSKSGGAEIDRISTSGTVTSVTATGAFPDGLGFVGTDLWFAEYQAADLARLPNAA